VKASFLAALVAAVVASQASAQVTTYFPAAAPSCASGQCPRVAAAVSQVRSVVAEGFHTVGNYVAPPVTTYSAPPACANTTSQKVECAKPKRQPIFPRLHHFVTGK